MVNRPFPDVNKTQACSQKIPTRKLTQYHRYPAFFLFNMPPADKSAAKTFPDKLAEASVTVLDLTMESFRMMVKGDRVLTRVRGSVLPTIAGPIVLFALYASFFAAIRSTGEQTGSDGDELTVRSATDPHWSRQGILPSLGSSVISLMSMAIGLLVSFRYISSNRTAYFPVIELMFRFCYVELRVPMVEYRTCAIPIGVSVAYIDLGGR